MKNSELTHQHYLIFTSSAHHFALPTHCVREIIYPHPVTPLPFVPSCIDGLINVEGDIAVQVNVATLCGTPSSQQPSQQPSQQSGELILIETGRALCALRVDNVIEQAAITVQTLQETSPPIDAALLCGEALYKQQRVFIIAPDCIGALVQTSPLPELGTGFLGKMEAQEHAEDNTTIACLVFSLNGDSYALALKNIIEIVEAEDFTTLPDAPACLMGFSLLRNQTLPIIDLATAIGHSTSTTERNFWLIIERHHTRYGLCISSLQGIQNFPTATFQESLDTNAFHSGLFIYQNSSTLLLNPDRIVSDALVNTLAPFITQSIDEKLAQQEDTESFLTVVLQEKTYAIPVQQVKRITPFFPMETLHNAPDTLCGAINIDGNIIPVITLDKAAPHEHHHTGEYIVVGNASQDWAIRVDAAHHIVKVPLSKMQKSSSQEGHFLNGMAHINHELVPLLDFSFINHSYITSHTA
jgi:chemotaxis signal transduction protein